MSAVQDIPANVLAVHALAAMGKGDTEIAQTLQMDRSTAWRLRHKDLLDPTLIAHASKTIGDKMLLGATAAMDAFLDKAESGELKECSPSALIKMSATAIEASQGYAAHCGAQNFLGETLASYGIGTSHSVSRVTLEQRVTVETTPQPVVIEARKA